MIDIHSHIIFQVDDGARDIEESMELLKSDYQQGASVVFATPHYSIMNPVKSAAVQQKLKILRNKLNEIKLPVELYSGNEILYFDSIVDHLEQGEICTLAESRYILVEFYLNDSYQHILRAVRNLRRNGYWPVIAHAERFAALQKHGLDEIISSGAYIQVSTEPISFHGINGILNPECRFIRAALHRQQVSFLGTDMHRMDRRPPILKNPLKQLAKLLDEEYFFAVTEGNPQKIIDGFEI